MTDLTHSIIQLFPQSMLRYSQSQAPHRDVKGTPGQVCITSPIERLTLISGGNAASVTYIDTNKCFQNIFFPHLMRSLDQENVLSVYGNASDNKGEYALFELPYGDSGFDSIILKDDIDPGILDSELLPEEALAGTVFAGKRHLHFVSHPSSHLTSQRSLQENWAMMILGIEQTAWVQDTIYFIEVLPPRPPMDLTSPQYLNMIL